MMSTNISIFSPLLLLLASASTTTVSVNAAEFHICGTSYLDAETNCRTNPKCFVGDIAVGAPPDDCPPDTPTCFTIVSTVEACGGDDIQVGGDADVVGDEHGLVSDHAQTTPPPREPLPQPPLKNGLASELADSLMLTIKMDANFDHGVDCASHQADWALCYTQSYKLLYAGRGGPYTNTDYYIYFSSIHRLLHVDHPDFEHHHVVGDLTYIKPKSSFTGFEPGNEVVLPLVFEYWSVQETDKMPRFFIVDGRDNSTSIIPNTDTEDMHQFVTKYTSSKKTEGDNNVPMTAENRFMKNLQLSEGAEAVDTSTTRIIPTAFRTEVSETAQTFDATEVSLVNANLLGLLQSGAEELISKIFMKPVTTTGEYTLTLVINTLPDDIAGPESYMMDVTVDGTTITASDAKGLFYGIMSFLSLIDISNESRGTTIKEMTIHDKPRFAYRGHQIDSARNFRSKEAVMQTIDAMALYKLNNLHFGLSNDEGWRLEIPGIEELTTVGSKRCFDLTEETCLLTQLGAGPYASEEQQFYTVADFVEILKYAAARNVKVAPEFNMPGHARAAVVSMEARAKKGDDSLRLMDPEDETELLTVQFYDRSSIINPCLDSSVRFVVKLVDEVVKMYAEAQLGLDAWQFGGDEAKNILLGGGYSAYDIPKEKPFSKSPACIKKMQEDPTIGVDTDAANYWALTVDKILAQKGIREMMAWEDGLNGMTKDQFEVSEIAVNFWSTLFWGATDVLVDASKTGFGVILANPDYLYFDFPYEVHPEERGYYWGARENSVAKVFSFAPENLPQNAETSLDRDGNSMDVSTPDVPAPFIKGMQGQTWSETVRTDSQHWQMTFPRVLAVAERAWHRASWELDWTPNQDYNPTSGHVPKDELATDFKGFNTVLGCREVRKIWQRLGIEYRVPPPGAKVEAGMLDANTELPCTRIQYSTDGGINWKEYMFPVEVGEGKVVSVRSLSSDGALESRVVIIDQQSCSNCQGVCESNSLMPFNTPHLCSSSEEEEATDISFPSLESSEPTLPPTTENIPIEESQPCMFCEGREIDFEAMPSNAGGQTCGDIKKSATEHIAGDHLCNVIQATESACCPPPPTDPCAFCSGNTNLDSETPLPEAGGNTCSEMQQIASTQYNNGDPLCESIKTAESKCCPAPTVPCGFCDSGIPDLALVVAEAGGQTCGELLEIAASHVEGDAICSTLQKNDESKCCPTLADKLANNLNLVIEMDANFDHGIDCASHQADWALCYSQHFSFVYMGGEAYTDNNFHIYFSSIHRLLHVDHPDFEHHHVVGDLTYIKPKASFKGFEFGSEVTLPLVFEYWSVQETDKMPRFFIVNTGDGSTAIMPNTDTENMYQFVTKYTSSKKTEDDNNVPMTAENRYARNMELSNGIESDATTRIIPTPFRTEVKLGDANADDDGVEPAQTFDVTEVSLVNANLLGLLQSGAEELIEDIFMKPVTTTGEYTLTLVINTLPDDIAGPESYMMDVTVDGTTITASDAKGLFYGIMSFLSLIDISNESRGTTIKEMTIHDKPRFAYRGHQIDSARNFRSKEAVMQTIDAMALYKLNNLHFGLSNDEGWRLEIPGIEELTTVGSKRCFDLTEETCLLTQLGAGPYASEEQQFYTVADFVEILKYAAARNVKVAPEFNMPGHARAAVVSMEARAKKGDDSLRLMDPEDETELLTVQFYDRSSIINPCLDSSVRFVVKLVDEVVKMYAEAQLGLDAWQFGGDEAKNILLGGGYSAYDIPKEKPFSKSPACIKKMQEDPTIGVDTDAANYWALTVDKILAQKGIREMMAWEDGLNGMTKDQFEVSEIAVNFWSTLFWGATGVLVDASKTGFGVILANPDYLYFDFPYEVHPEERGYYWGARENSVAKVFSFAPENLPQNAETSLDRDGNAMNITTPVWPAPVIKGMQGQTWSETVRTDSQHWQMTFPRVLAVAERAWHRASWELDWTPNQDYNPTSGHVPKDELATDFKGFNTVLGCREVRKIWQRLGIEYRVPPPGAKVEAGMLKANTELPCTRIQYSTDGGNNWFEYFTPQSVEGEKVVSVRSLSSDGALESRVEHIYLQECSSCQGVCESNPLMPFNTPKICSSEPTPSPPDTVATVPLPSTQTNEPPPPSTTAAANPPTPLVTTAPPIKPTITTTNLNPVVALYKNPEGNEFFCGDMFSTITKQCLLSKPCPGGLSSICENHSVSTTTQYGCFKASHCTSEYKAAGATTAAVAVESNVVASDNDVSEPCRICGEAQIHAEATVFFEGEEFLCREFDGVFNEGRRDKSSASCKLAKELYTDTCCIKASDFAEDVGVAPAPSPSSVFDGGEYPTLWIWDNPTSSGNMMVLGCSSMAILLLFPFLI